MPDPIATALAVGAIGGALGNLLSDGAKRAVPVLWRGVHAAIVEAMQHAAPQAREQFQANAVGFVAALSTEIVDRASNKEGDATRLQDAEQAAAEVVRRLADPDVAVTLQEALLAAGCTPSEKRHSILAKLVGAKLNAEADSARSAASSLAVRAARSLSGEHLRALGRLAFLYYAGRPAAADAQAFGDDTESRRYDPAETGEAREARLAAQESTEQKRHERAVAYAARFRAQLAQHTPFPAAPDALILHLVAASCVVLHDSGLDFSGVAGRPLPAPSDKDRTAEYYCVDALRRLPDQDYTAEMLRDLWRAGLSRAVPTPAGLLIGLAVHDELTGERRAAEWEWSAAGDAALALWEPAPAEPDYNRMARDPRFAEAAAKSAYHNGGR
jgi:hypothetical protein